MKWIAVALLTIVWMAAVTWYWLENVPLMPTKSVKVADGHFIHARGVPSEIAVVPFRQTSAANSPFHWHGPIDIWSFPEGRKSREFLTSDDNVLIRPPYATTEILVQRNGRLEIWDVFRQKLVTPLPDTGEVRRFRTIPDRRQVLVQYRQELSLYDFHSDRPVWTTAAAVLSDSGVGDIFIARTIAPAGPRPLPKVGVKAFRIADGQPDSRFDSIGPNREIQLSVDGRWAAARSHDDRWTICEQSSGRVIWKAPTRPSFDYCQFSEDGEEFFGHENVSKGPARMLRWRSSDGVPLPDMTDAEQQTQAGHVTADGRYALISSVSSPASMVTRSLSRPWVLLDSWRGRLLGLLHRVRYKVVDRSSQRPVGALPEDARPIVLGDVPGFLMVAPGRIDYFGVPLRHNSWWLAKYAFGPPVLLMMLLRLGRRTRRGRTPDSCCSMPFNVEPPRGAASNAGVATP